MTTAPRETTAAPSPNEEYCPLATYHPPTNEGGLHSPKKVSQHWRTKMSRTFCTSLHRSPGTCRWKARWSQGLSVSCCRLSVVGLVEVSSGHPRPSLSGTHRCATEPRVTLWQSANPSWCGWSPWHHVLLALAFRVEGCDSNWLQLMCNWESLHPCLTGSAVQALSRHHCQSFLSFPPNCLRVVGILSSSSSCSRSHRTCLACCLQCEIHLVHSNANLFLSRKIDQLRCTFSVFGSYCNLCDVPPVVRSVVNIFNCLAASLTILTTAWLRVSCTSKVFSIMLLISDRIVSCTSCNCGISIFLWTLNSLDRDLLLLHALELHLCCLFSFGLFSVV